ncbi:MAG: glycoside hydrolase family 3 protein [Halanaerobiales bacterium]
MKKINVFTLMVLTGILLVIMSVINIGSVLASDAPLYLDPSASVEERVDDLLLRMSLMEKIGQMTQADKARISPQYVQEENIGSVLSGGGSVPVPNNPESWADMYDQYQSAALDTRLGIPIIYGIDAVHGHNNLKGATIFPHNIGLGATRDPELVERVAEITALETAATGLDWNFAPCVAVVRDIRWGRTYESFGETPELQSLLTAAYVRGMQGPDNEMSGRYLVATAKHYIADGAAVWGTGGSNFMIDQGNADISEEELREIHLPGYQEAIDAGVGSVMISFSSFQGLNMHEHEYLITDLLKGELGFDGLVVSDWQGVDRLPGSTYYNKVVRSVNSGIDMFMAAYTWPAFIPNLQRAVQTGDISEERIDDAVRRILTLKFKIGLFEAPYADRELLEADLIGSPEHREVAREAVRKSMVLLKNDDLLPLKKDMHLYVAGSSADNIGRQSGGWTITWQGLSGNITEGTSILEGIENALEEGKVVRDINQADAAVIIVGEKPYAEGVGDDADLQLSDADIEELEKVEDSGKPILVIMVSGRPMMISEYIQGWDAFVAAWLPGTEGQGVADVIFGDHNFTGKLPVTWPGNINQVPINHGDENYNPLFEYDFGLSMDL